MITVTLEPNVRLDPEALQDAVRRVEFTPTDMRVWVTGTLEPWQSGSEVDADADVNADADADAPAEFETLSLALVDSDTGQRFLLTLTPGTEAADLDPSRAGSLTVWGVVETISGVPDLVLHVEGVERAP